MRITVPAEVSAALDSGTDRDYFRFFATATGNYTVYTTGNADTICAFEFSGNPLTTDDDSGEGLNCRATARLDAGRTYHVRVRQRTTTIRSSSASSSTTRLRLEPRGV